MRDFITVILALSILCSSAASQDWKIVSSPTEDNITGICSVHPDTFFIVTSKGNCARTYDGGKSWQVAQVAAGIHLEDVSFADSKLGVVCGRSGVLYRTVDGGATWESKSLKDTIPWFIDVEMFDAQTGLVIGMTRDSASPLRGLALRTTDSGLTWNKQKPLGLGYAEILYNRGGPVYLLSFGQLHSSDDFGKRWKSAKTVDGLAARTVSIFGKTGLLAGPNGMCAFSSDTGQTWTKLDQWSEKIYIAAEMIDEEVGYIGGANATVMRTADGGHTWKAELMARSFDVLDMCLIGDRLFAVGSNGGIIAKKVK
jgi:photosystem II stability/assembly factor-like uncharacterized protein